MTSLEPVLSRCSIVYGPSCPGASGRGEVQTVRRRISASLASRISGVKSRANVNGSFALAQRAHFRKPVRCDGRSDMHTARRSALPLRGTFAGLLSLRLRGSCTRSR